MSLRFVSLEEILADAIQANDPGNVPRTTALALAGLLLDDWVYAELGADGLYRFTISESGLARMPEGAKPEQGRARDYLGGETARELETGRGAP